MSGATSAMGNDCAVYVAGTDGWEYIKIGVARNVNKRLGELQTGCPVRLKMLSVRNGLSAAHAADVETALHILLAEHHSNGEWFKIGHSDVHEILRRFGLSDRAPKRKRTGQEQTASARRAAFLTGRTGGRPPALGDLTRAQWAEFDRDWKDDAISIKQMARKWKVSDSTISRKAIARKLGRKA